VTRALLSLLAACWLGGCAGDDPPPAAPDPSPINDAQITPVLEGGALEDRITLPPDIRDAAITEPTPILDLPLVIARPSEPLSTAQLEVIVVDPAFTPLADVSVSTGGPAVFTSQFGLASVRDVYGVDFTNVYAFGSGHTLSHARIPIRAGEAGYVVLVVAPREVLRLDDLAAEGVVETEEASATFDEASFELPWGGGAKGPGMIGLTVLTAPGEAGAVPGAMQARVAGQLEPVAAALSFELSVAQGSTELALVKQASVELQWADYATRVDAAAQTLYYFDSEAGAFVPRGSLEHDALSPNLLRAKIDRTGHWLIGSSAGPVRCARAAAQSSAGPVARAGMLFTRTFGFGVARAAADDLGSGCALLPEDTSYQAQAFGQLADGTFVSARGAVDPGASSACDDTCATTVLEAEPISIGCVRATISIPWLASAGVSSLESDALGERNRLLPTNEAFCIDGRVGAQLTLDHASLCSGGGVITVSAPTAPGASCATESNCADLGTITCCMTVESCLNNTDDDCDGVVDEGCVCGGIDCTTSSALDRCCTATEACGQRSTITSECVGYESFGIPIGCPTATVPGLAGDTEIVQGCCRTAGECGLMWGSVGCVAAADVPRVWGAGTTLPSVECTP
jgi:hypothetical protein